MTDTELFAMPGLARAQAVLDAAFRGRHHIPGNVKVGADGKWVWLEANVSGGVSTFDYDVLTRLVFAAHDLCVRVEIQRSGGSLIRLMLSPRYTREGSTMDRHPGLIEAYEQYRKGRD